VFFQKTVWHYLIRGVNLNSCDCEVTTTKVYNINSLLPCWFRVMQEGNGEKEGKRLP
jgi:hypothetical protein